jgi:hypothetical protein
MTVKEVQKEVNHVFKGGANGIRVMELILRLIKLAEKETRYAAIDLILDGGPTKKIISKVQNISVLKEE